MFLGEVYTTPTADFNNEAMNMYVLRVTVSDGFLQDEDNLTVHVLNDTSNKPLLLNLPNSLTISENHVGDVFDVNTANEESTQLTYHLSYLTNSDDHLFAISSSSGM